jgi:hypothetical protein
MTTVREQKLIPLGTTIPHYGVIGMVAWLQGERYYGIVDKFGSVALMPAVLIEESCAEDDDGNEAEAKRRSVVAKDRGR